MNTDMNGLWRDLAPLKANPATKPEFPHLAANFPNKRQSKNLATFTTTFATSLGTFVDIFKFLSRNLSFYANKARRPFSVASKTSTGLCYRFVILTVAYVRTRKMIEKSSRWDESIRTLPDISYHPADPWSHRSEVTCGCDGSSLGPSVLMIFV